MNEVLLANLFFIITGMAILVVAAFLTVALFHLIRVLRALRAILERVDEATDHFVEDARALRDQIVSGAAVARTFSAVMQALAGARQKRRTSRKKRDDAGTDSGASSDAS